MKPVAKWLAITLGLGSLWWVTHAVAFYFFGVLAFFVTAFQATVNEITKLTPEQPAEPTIGEAAGELPRRLAEVRVYRRANPQPAQETIDLRDEAEIVLS